MKEFKYEIKKHIATVSKSDDGKMYKGITLTHEEAKNLGQILLGI